MDSFLNVHANERFLQASGMDFSLPNTETLNELSAKLCSIDLISKYSKKEQTQSEQYGLFSMDSFNNSFLTGTANGNQFAKQGKFPPNTEFRNFSVPHFFCSSLNFIL